MLTVIVALGPAPEGVNLAALDDWTIVVAADAIPSEVYAAHELQHFLEQAGAARLPIAAEPPQSGPAGNASPCIFVGPSAAMLESPAGFDVTGFGEEDLRIVIRDSAVAIAGGRPRGTLYGVYTFLEDYLGVRFLAHDHVHVPPIGDWRVAGPVDRFYHPPLSFRWSFYAETNQYPEFAARNRTNTVPTDPRLGGKTTLQNVNHTFCFLVPSREFGKEHPEYYAMVDGQRLWEVADDGTQTQLCLTNPDVLRITTQRVLEDLRAHPGMKNISVSQNDCSAYCRCPQCAAIDDREGTPMGSLLTFVNAVADEVAKEFPDALVGTLAYSYSRKPPKTIVPRPNVQIQLCSGECCLLHPITDPDCPLNQEFCEDMREWGRICDNVSIWNYNTNFANYQLPCPNLRVIEPNIRYFVANNAIGVFMQGVYNTEGGEFSDLRNYLMANLLWDPNRSGEALIREFLALHYKSAAPPICQFITRVHDNAARRGLHRACSGQAADYGVDDGIAQAGLEAFAEALELADDDAVRARVEKASICAYRAALEPLFNLRGDSLADPGLLASMTPALERFSALCERYNVTLLSEGGTFRAFKEQRLPIEALSAQRILELPQVWAFKKDPDNTGQDQEWFRLAPDDSWKPISIHDVWERQGHDRYDGYAWYTIEVEVPAIEAKPVWLLFGAVDETFDVWINSESAGSRGGEPTAIWDKPAALDVTNLLRPGKTNRITVRVHDAGYAGGIWKPVWITAGG